jgi:hypothetical protein
MSEDIGADWNYVLDVFSQEHGPKLCVAGKIDEDDEKNVVLITEEWPVEIDSNGEDSIAPAELIKFEHIDPARIYAGLKSIFPDIHLLDSLELIPIEIATSDRPKPAIALYLYATHYDSFSYRGDLELSDVLGVKPSTAQKYLNRMEREIMKNKIGGKRDSRIGFFT